MFDTPMRYPGGKGRLSQYVIDLFELNDLTGGHYVETYAGGAGIALNLLYLEYASHIHLNDLNRSVFAFWKSVCEQPEEMCRLVRKVPLTVAQWKKQKAIQFQEKPSQLALGFSTLFLNRTNRSGIITGGIIGGKEQTGAWGIGARFNREELVRRIEKVASYGPRISLYNMDAAAFITRKLPKITEKCLVYLDPPYYARGRNLYENHYTPKDHAKIAGLVGSIKQEWMVSYDDTPALRALYSQYEQEVFSLRYSAQTFHAAKEVMIFCPSLKRPGVVKSFRGIAA
jgi:DNA adenine methylase